MNLQRVLHKSGWEKARKIQRVWIKLFAFTSTANSTVLSTNEIQRMPKFASTLVVRSPQLWWWHWCERHTNCSARLWSLPVAKWMYRFPSIRYSRQQENYVQLSSIEKWPQPNSRTDFSNRMVTYFSFHIFSAVMKHFSWKLFWEI